ncbi:MAG: pyrimidine dimer DNA glycosylase/endonuclease V [archaeon]|nr:pyrimidine dimer DNA glycosylase/endonuclease V [Nanoarchaeota archaeon]
MVRINIINPKKLADQHLIAEYNEILMLFGHVKKFPKVHSSPKEYCLGRGHINFFKNKLLYLKKRHELLKKEMILRGFKPEKKISLSHFRKNLCNDWKPKKKDYYIIQKRLIDKIKLKPNYYKYYGKIKPITFYKKILKRIEIKLLE